MRESNWNLKMIAWSIMPLTAAILDTASCRSEPKADSDLFEESGSEDEVEDPTLDFIYHSLTRYNLKCGS